MRLATCFVLLILIPAPGYSQNTFDDPEAAVKDRFWGQLYANGGETFFCQTPFTSKGFLLSEGYIYPLIHIRNALQCGTSSQCEENQSYRRMAADLHNMVPVQSRIEMRRRSAKYARLGPGASENVCGIRESTQFIEPPDRVKGDIARTVAYMVSTYGLPWIGVSSTFKLWNDQDSPDDSEITRHRRIVNIQGNENPFVTDPASLAGL